MCFFKSFFCTSLSFYTNNVVHVILSLTFLSLGYQGFISFIHQIHPKNLQFSCTNSLILPPPPPPPPQTNKKQGGHKKTNTSSGWILSTCEGPWGLTIIDMRIFQQMFLHLEMNFKQTCVVCLFESPCICKCINANMYIYICILISVIIHLVLTNVIYCHIEHINSKCNQKK